MPISDYIKQIRAKVGKDLLLVPGVTAVVINKRDEILLQLRRDTGTWAPPSGSAEPGETVAECAVREVREESGVTIVPEAVVAVLSGKEYNVVYPNGDKLATVTTVFRCRPVGDITPRVNDDESQDFRYFPGNARPENMLPRHRWIIGLALSKAPGAYFDPPSA
ncbi:MAG: NUDIX domain-containing protein [Chloroflexi bacterium]|nr:NUDIX domain-containing protein [Chloroflexota bacterium]MCY3583686.1 NUDIX domain-containing protein [Chloroflexota bacterium]MCY3716966.1 NUDIX domain-containing protein [Chloroflexota bacterium]MDE2650150.1 NUDIX domain-containing protein [Chloroflexota bacterium]MXV92864.1 NUDIX domain-containing protein [Chloroflexota bacterium]